MTGLVLEATRTQLVELRLRLRADGTLTADGDALVLRCSRHEVSLALGPAERAVLKGLADGALADVDVARLADRGDPDAGATALVRSSMLVQRLATVGWLARTLTADGQPVATSEPATIGGAATPRAVPADPALSRFTLLQRGPGGLLASSPRGTASVLLQSGDAVRVVLALCEDADGRPPSPDPLDPLEQAVLAMLAGAGLLTSRSADDEQDAPALAQWSLPDLLLHATSRAGRSLAGYGGTYAARARLPELPAVRPPEGELIALPVPDLGRGPAAQQSFGGVLEARRTVRAHDDALPITLGQLSELLYRTARERARLIDDDGAELSNRPYPCGGGRYELEIYPVVTLCSGLTAGVYRYLPDRHALEVVAPVGEQVLGFAAMVSSTGLFDRPAQVSLIVTARFGRVMVKYESMAYALVLKHVGVLYQSLYLTCTAMGLAPCGLGGGDSDSFARLTGLDYYAESSVGEFLVGSLPAARSGGDAPEP